jgi:tetraacyldisaccharide 4'-kinase
VVVNGVPEHTSLLAGRERLMPDVLQMSLHGNDAVRVDGLAPAQPLEHFRRQRVHAVAGIGNPGRFFRDLRARGLDVIEHPFADHHPFVAADLTFPDDFPVLMTEKDAVRCRALATERLWYVPVVARFSETQGRELLDRVVTSLSP